MIGIVLDLLQNEMLFFFCLEKIFFNIYNTYYMMMVDFVKILKVASFFVLLCFFQSVIALNNESTCTDKTSAKLNLECEVYLFVSLIKCSEEALDIFKGNKVDFIIVSNSENGTDIKISSKNKYLKCEEHSLDYKVIMNLNNKEIDVNPQNENIFECPYNRDANGVYSFSLRAQLSESIYLSKIEMLGDYEDTLTISVSAK